MDENQTNVQAGGSVVLVHDGAAGCAMLLRALSARGLPPVVVHDEPGAMVALAELSKHGSARRVLIVVEPGTWGRVDELMVAVHDYHWSAYCWQFVAGDLRHPQLSRLDVASHVVGADGAMGTGPVGKIHRRTRPVDRLLVQAPGHELSTREVVTQQELTMLLGPAPGEAG